ncbi:MAG: hypothetical protein HC905_00065 [Bacteroidales bacterium]|nr:hypothetical protein [Bacteroidales bacterium]
MNSKKVTFLVLSFVLAMLAGSCIKDEIDLDNISTRFYWNPKIGLPLAYGRLTIDDLIESIDSSDNVYEDDNKFLSLIYSSNILSENASDLMKISDQQFNEVLLESQYNLPPFPTQDTIALTRSNKYTFDLVQGAVIDSIRLKTGTMIFNITSSYKYRGILKITVPALIKNKKALEINIDINRSDGMFSYTENIDITGYRLDLEHPNATDNLITYNYTAKLINTGAGVSVGDKIEVDINFNDIAFSSMFGYIGQLQLLNYQSNINIPLFRNVSEPNIQFANPILKIITANSFGVPARIELFNMKTYSEKDDKTVLLGFTPGVNPFYITYPQTIGGTKTDTVAYSRMTTNIDQALAIGPSNFLYGIRSTANPAGKTSNYVTDSSRIKIDMDIELPLDLKTSLLEFSDTLDMDLSGLEENTDKIKSFLIHSSFENGMPVDLNLQVILLNEGYQPVDTLYKTPEQPVIKSATLNQQGRVTGTTKKDIDIVFSKSRIDALQNVRYALVKAGIITSNNGSSYVKFYSDYLLNVNFGIQTELEITEE